MNRVLVTGATGFVGRHSIDGLLDRGFEVHAVGGRRTGTPGPGVEWHRVDVLDREQVVALLCAVQPSHLLHFAWYVEPGSFWTSAANLSWVGASLELLRSFVDHGGRRAVLAGTCAEYDWSTASQCSEQETPLVPSTLYGACKHGLQQIVSAYARQTGVSFAWGRIFWLYGPHEPPQRLVPSIAAALLRGQTAECSRGTQRRDFLHVRDAADAFVSLLDSTLEGPVNVGSGEAIRVRDAVETIGRLTGRPELIRLGALLDRDGDPPVLCADVTKLRHGTGWSPRHSLETGLRHTVEWWRDRIQEHAG